MWIAWKIRQSTINIPIWQWKMTLEGIFYVSESLKKY